MSHNKPKTIEGEILGEAENIEQEITRDIREGAKKGGVFIGTLNIMTQPAKNLITEPLTDLYHSRYHGKYQKPKHVFAFDLGLIAIGATLAAVAIYFSLIWKPYDPVKLTLTALPKNPTANGEVVLNLNVSNLSDSMLENTVATFKLPKEFKLVRSSLPYIRDKNMVELGAVDIKTDVSERLVGTITGAVGKNIKATATISYTDNKGKNKTRGATVVFKISNSAIGAEFNIPDTVFVGQPFSGSIRYWNKGNNISENTIIVPNWPNGFVLTSSDLPLKSGRWTLGTLGAGSEGKINFTGTINSNDSSAGFAIETGIKSGTEILTESQTSKTITINNPKITVTAEGNNSARLGDTLNVKVTYKNTGDHTLSKITIKPILNDGLKLVNENVISDPELKPGESKSINYEIELPNKLPEDLNDVTNPQFKIRFALSGVLSGNGNVEFESPNLLVKIPSSIALKTIARYFSESGDQLGRGPLPPNVGKSTRYWVFWNIQNTSGDITNVRVTGVLPENVAFTGKISAPFGDAPEFDPITRTITWNAGEIPAWPGVKSSAIGTAFELALIPTSNQVATYPILISSQKITGTDIGTNLKLEHKTTDTNSHLNSDPQAAQTGKVK